MVYMQFSFAKKFSEVGAQMFVLSIADSNNGD